MTDDINESQMRRIRDIHSMVLSFVGWVSQCRPEDTPQLPEHAKIVLKNVEQAMQNGLNEFLDNVGESKFDAVREEINNIIDKREKEGTTEH